MDHKATAYYTVYGQVSRPTYWTLNTEIEVYRLTGQVLWLLVQEHSGASNWKTMACYMQDTLTQPALFSSLPFTLHISLYLSCCIILLLAGREQGMLIKGCENQKKQGGLIGT